MNFVARDPHCSATDVLEVTRRSIVRVGVGQQVRQLENVSVFRAECDEGLSQLEDVLDIVSARSAALSDLRSDLRQRGFSQVAIVPRSGVVRPSLDGPLGPTVWAAELEQSPLIATLLTHVQLPEDGFAHDVIHAVGRPPAFRVRSRHQRDDPTWCTDDSSVVGRSLPEAPRVPADVAADALSIGKPGSPEQRPVPEQPNVRAHLGLILAEAAFANSLLLGIPSAVWRAKDRQSSLPRIRRLARS